MNQVKYYKDSNFTVGKYALNKMLNIFGIATPTERVAKYFGFEKWQIQEWEKENYVPDEEAFLIIEKVTSEKPEDYVTEKEQSIDFILN